MDQGEISSTLDERGLRRLRCSMLRSTADLIADIMKARDKSLTETVRRIVSVRWYLEACSREGASVYLRDDAGAKELLHLPNLMPTTSEEVVGIACNVHDATATAIDDLSRIDGGVPLGETLRRACVLYVEAARNQGTGGRVEIVAADGQLRQATLI